MGMIFGFIFGIMDIEDATYWTMISKLVKEEKYCNPIGITFGVIGGFIVSVVDSYVFFVKFRDLESNKEKVGFSLSNRMMIMKFNLF